jgi:hypothetical protein
MIQYVPAIMSAVQGTMSIFGGKAQRQMAEAEAQQRRTLATLRVNENLEVSGIQSQQVRLQAIQARLSHERAAEDTLRTVTRTQAAIVARAAAGGVRAFEGSAGKVLSESGAAGARDYGLSMENASLAERFGFLQADVLSSTAKAQAALDIAGAEAGAQAIENKGRMAESEGFMKGVGYFADAGYKYWKLGEPAATPGGTQPKKNRYSLIGDFPFDRNA